MSARRRSAAGMAVLLLGAAAFASLRLRDLPVFGDEAIFLRHARLVRAAPALYLWTSIRIAAAPLHTWMLASAMGWTSDPVLSGRILSLAAGLAALPALAWAVRGLSAVSAPEARSFPSVSPFLAAVFMAVSPFFVTAERLGRVDSLFTLETILVAGAALRFAAAVHTQPRRTILRAAVVLGAGMGLMMLTRTAVSYPFWAMPVFAVLVHHPSVSRSSLRRGAAWLAASLAIGGAIFAPFLLADGPADLATRLFHYAPTHPALTAAARLELILSNGRMAAESLETYLTGPVLLAALAGVVLLARARRWRTLAYLGAWEAVALLPAMMFAADYFPRYALPAAVPWLALCALGWETLAVEVSRSGPSGRSRAGAVFAVAIAACVLWPAARSARFVSDWRSAPWTPIDRFQLVSGWPAGASAERAARFAAGRAAERPTIILTPEVSGNPTDTVWLLLEGRPGVDLAFAYDALREPLHDPWPREGGEEGGGGAGGWRAREDLLRGGAPRRIGAGDRRPVIFVCPDPILTADGWRPAQQYFSRIDPDIVLRARFSNPPPSPREPPAAATAVFEVRSMETERREFGR